MTNPPTFSQPRSASGGAKFEWIDHIGQLVLVEPKGIEYDVATSNGPANAIAGDVTFIDAPGGPEEYPDALIFPRVVFSQCKDAIGEMVLGRVQPYTSKAGRETVQIGEHTAQDGQYAQRFIDDRNARRAASSFSQPLPQEMQPQQHPQGYGQPQQQAPQQQQYAPPAQAPQQQPQFAWPQQQPQQQPQYAPPQQQPQQQPPQATPPF